MKHFNPSVEFTSRSIVSHLLKKIDMILIEWMKKKKKERKKEHERPNMVYILFCWIGVNYTLW